jgi:hypothetical protein
MFAALFAFGWSHGRPEFFPVGAAINGALAVTCLTVGVRNFPKVESYVFALKSGATAFLVGRCGPERDGFDAFVARLIEAMKRAPDGGQKPFPRSMRRDPRNSRWRTRPIKMLSDKTSRPNEVPAIESLRWVLWVE